MSHSVPAVLLHRKISMPRLPFRSATPALLCVGLIAGMVTTTASALPPTPADDVTATAPATIAAPLSAINAKATATLSDAINALSDARDVTVDIRTSGLKIAADATVVDTSDLSDAIEKLQSLDVTPALLVPKLTEEAEGEIQTVREGTAALRGQLDAAIQKKAEEEAAAKAAAEAAAAAQAEAEAAAAKAAAEAAAAKAAATAAVPAVNVNVDPASAQGIARSMMAANYGWGDDQFACLVSLWNKESGWRVNAASGSGAYGIPQALPGSKMASAGADWQTNPATQIAWGLGYISGRYGNACGAWAHSQSTGWY